MPKTKKIEGTLVRQVQQDTELLNSLSPMEFEQLVGELLSSFGWEIQVKPNKSNDEYDFLAFSNIDPSFRVTWLVECTHARPLRPIGAEEVRSLYGARLDAGVSNAILATTGRFTQGAKEFAESKSDLHLVDHDQIAAWLEASKLRVPQIGINQATADV